MAYHLLIAIVTFIVPANSLSSASCTSFSERASKAEVESSKIKILGSPITPLVIDNRCFCHELSVIVFHVPHYGE